MVLRLTILLTCFSLLYLALIFNLYSVQITHGKDYLVRAESQYAAGSLFDAPRGDIYFTDKAGNFLPAVTDKDFPLIYAVPKVISDPLEAANQVSAVLNLPIPDLQAKFSKKDDTYELIVKKATDDEAEKIKEADIKGIFVDIVPERFYPFGNLSSQVVGFVAPNSTDTGVSGKYGLELFYDDRLAGTVGKMDGGKMVAPEAGKDLDLTIDPNIQIEASRILKNLIDTYKAPSGAVIVEEPSTGKILAMDSFPNFDPNNYSNSAISDFLNPVTQKIYEPGSVFKIFTMAAGIDSGKITPDTKFYDTGKLDVSGRTIENWDHQAHGSVTMTNVIELSLNTGAAFAERQTGDSTFQTYLTKFGFSEKTGIDLPGELKGDLKRLKKGAPAVAFATASFGQGVAATPLEVINAAAAIANGGELMRPYLNSELQPQTIRQVIEPGTARQVTDMMVSAVDKAKVAAIKGYSLAGKTGTAQIPDFKNGGYSDRVINTYVGFGPTKDPKFVILFKLDDLDQTFLAGQTVVPAFRDLAEFVLNYYNVPPDRL